MRHVCVTAGPGVGRGGLRVAAGPCALRGVSLTRLFYYFKCERCEVPPTPIIGPLATSQIARLTALAVTAAMTMTTLICGCGCGLPGSGLRFDLDLIINILIYSYDI